MGHKVLRSQKFTSSATKNLIIQNKKKGRKSVFLLEKFNVWIKFSTPVIRLKDASMLHSTGCVKTSRTFPNHFSVPNSNWFDYSNNILSPPLAINCTN